ncbi:MAG: DUF4352 domain-containing protein [Acidimicrobiales bacterium]|nr:DUF4352 domain-containing protein [Acidimicrobiales bacterium]
MTEYKDAKAQAKASKAQAKAMRPWFKKKRFILGGLLAIIVIAAAAGGGGDDTDGTDVAANNTDVTNAPIGAETEATTAATAAPVKANYPGQQNKDHVAGADGTVEFTGFTTTVKNIRRQASDNQFLDDEICADVTMLNRDTKAQDYSEFDFKLQTPSGNVKSYELTNSTLDSGQLVNGGTKSGTVCFTDPEESGQYIVIWKPDPFNADRGIWLVNL